MAEAKTQPSQEFEKVLKDSATEVASFERHDKSLLERIQHVLHSNPGAGAADRAGAVGGDLRRCSWARSSSRPSR